MSNEIEFIFENHWDDIKSGLKSTWKELTPHDFKQIDGSYDIFIGLAKRTYGLTKDEINQKLFEFYTSEGVEEMDNKAEKIKDKAKHEAGSLIDSVDNCVHQYLQTIKEKTLQYEENVVTYAKENPIKILGIAALASYTLSRILYSAR